MSNDSSEEKSQPGSEKKIRDARKKGQVPKSQDMITALVVFSCVVYLGVTAGTLVKNVNGLIEDVSVTFDSVNMVFAETWPGLVAKALDVLMSATFPLLIIIVFVVLMGNIIILKGVPFSAHPVKPDVKRLNPVDGFKRIFSMRNFLEFLKAIFKVLLLGTAFILVYKNSLPILFGASTCGIQCIYASFKYLFIPITITAVLAFFISGVFDLLLQKWLFSRDMRMSHSELKRERKDTDGSPEIRKERNRQRVALQASSAARGAHMASVMIGGPNSWIVGLRYRQGETKVPVIVHVVPSEQAGQVWFSENKGERPYVYDPALANEIARRSNIGDALPDLFFERVARILVKEKLI